MPSTYGEAILRSLSDYPEGLSYRDIAKSLGDSVSVSLTNALLDSIDKDLVFVDNTEIPTRYRLTEKGLRACTEDFKTY